MISLQRQITNSLIYITYDALYYILKLYYIALNLQSTFHAHNRFTQLNSKDM